MSNDNALTLKVGDETYSIDMDDLSWGELLEMETILGGSIDGANLESAKGVLALAFIAVKRKNPLVDIADLKALPLNGIEIVEGDSDKLPTDAGAAGDFGTQS